jgi:hypothetical protein
MRRKDSDSIFDRLDDVQRELLISSLRDLRGQVDTLCRLTVRIHDAVVSLGLAIDKAAAERSDK